MTYDTMIGIDLAKNVFQVHGALLSGEVKFRRKLSRQHFRRFMAGQGASIVVMEACGGAHYWSREMTKLGHEVPLITTNAPAEMTGRRQLPSTSVTITGAGAGHLQGVSVLSR